MPTNNQEKWEEKFDYLLERYFDGRIKYEELESFIRQEIHQAKIEGNLRREKEILIMMVDCEKEGWTIKRFIDSFAQIVDKNGRESNLKKQ